MSNYNPGSVTASGVVDATSVVANQSEMSSQFLNAGSVSGARSALRQMFLARPDRRLEAHQSQMRQQFRADGSAP